MPSIVRRASRSRLSMMADKGLSSVSLWAVDGMERYGVCFVLTARS